MGRSLHKLLCFFLVILMISALSLTAFAEESSAELHSLHFDIELWEDGSAYITETREIVFTGEREFTRYGVNNFFTGPRVFSDWQVSIDGTPASQLDEPDNENRPEDTFAVEDNDEGNTVYIYYRQQGSGKRIFQISYWVENAVKLYSDVGEFFWNLTGETGISSIGTLTATLTVPEGSPEEEFRIWAHGPLNGTFEKQPDGSAALRVDNVPVGTIVDIRSTLPADCFFGGWEQEGEALPTILAEEKELADSANAQREEEAREQAERDAYWAEYWAKREAWEAKHPVLRSVERSCSNISDSVYYFLEEHGVLLIVAILLFLPVLTIIGVAGLVIRSLRRRNEEKFRKSPAQSPQYYRDLPDNRPAPIVDRLVHFYDGRSNVSRQISATLLELNLKKLVQFQTTAGDATLLLHEQPDEALFPQPASQETAEPAEHTPSYQETLWDFLRGAAGGSGQIGMKDLKQYIKDNQEVAVNFRRSFRDAVERDYTKSVQSQDIERHLPRGSRFHLIFAAAAGVLAMLICMFSTLYDGIELLSSLLVGLITFAAALIVPFILHFELEFLFVQTSCRVLEQKSEDDLALWEAFGRFLDDFTTFDEKELPEFSVWREYMVYAVAMGKGQTVAKSLALKYPEAVSAGTNTFDDDMYRWMQDIALYDAMDSIGREVSEIKAPSFSSSSSDSSWSDSDGGGGGFSDSGGGSDSGSGGDFID